MLQYSSFMASWLHFTSSRVLETCISLHFPWSYKITELGASKKCKCNLSLQERLTWNVKLKDIKRQYCVVRGGKYLYSGDRAAVKVSRYPHVISLISYPCRLDTRGATGRCLRSSPRSGRKIDRFTARLQILRSQSVINSFTKKIYHTVNRLRSFLSLGLWVTWSLGHLVTQSLSIFLSTLLLTD